MPNVRVTIMDPSMTTQRAADVPDDQPMNRLVPALVTKMNLPTGQYTIHSKGLGRTLQDTETLSGAHITQNDTLRLMPAVQGAGLPATQSTDQSWG